MSSSQSSSKPPSEPFGYGTEYHEKLIAKLLRGETLTDEEFLKLDPSDPRNEGTRSHRIDPTGDGTFACDVEFQSGLPPPDLPPLMMLKMPSLLPEMCKVRYTELESPRYRKPRVEAMMGIKIDLVNDDKISATQNTEPMHPDDVKLMDMCRPLLGDDADEILGPRYFEAKGEDPPKKNLKATTTTGPGTSGGQGQPPSTKDPHQQQQQQRGVATTTTKKSEESKMRDEAAKDASWLKNTSYLSNDLAGRVHAFKSDVSEKLKEEATRKARKYDQADESNRRAEESFDLVKKRQLRRVEWEMPVFPNFEAAGFPGSNVLVTLDDEPPANDTASLPSRLVSKVENTNVKRRGKKVLSAALSTLVPRQREEAPPGVTAADYEWKRQYQVRVVKDGSERLALRVDENAKTATYERMHENRFEFDKCRLPEAAKLDDEAKLDPTWNGDTTVDFSDVPAFAPKERNEIRAKRRLAFPDVSSDEDEPPEEQLQGGGAPPMDEDDDVGVPRDHPGGGAGGGVVVEEPNAAAAPEKHVKPDDLFIVDDDDDEDRQQPKDDAKAKPAEHKKTDDDDDDDEQRKKMADLFGEDEDDDDDDDD